ncbi:MAG: murein biosynthesis integral membrane protein MurJ, partial [Spirochaetia bacterium]|nr:murein biosynthesis integral membrane protein MurJ [Spirochaetia bacterium]
MIAARNSLKLSFFTIISRVLGLVRDHYQAVFFGTGPIATAWEIAYMFPNMLRNLLAEGVLSQSFIPVYSDALKKSETEGRRIAGIILSFLILFLAVLVTAGILIFPYFIPLYTGRNADESFLTIHLSQVMFFFIMTTSLTAIFAGISNTHNFFTIPAMSPILLNLVLIASFLSLDFFEFQSEINAEFLAWGVIAGGVLQLTFQGYHVFKIGRWPRFKLDLKDPALRKIFTLMAPAVLGAGLFQINQMMDIALASYFIEDIGAVPALRYAHRLIQLPTGIIGVALSTAILPALVASLRKGEDQKNSEELIFALSFSFFLTVPAGIGLYLLGPEIINTIFYGGAWDKTSTDATWLALQFYCLGVPLYSTNKILTSSYYAYQDTKTPIKIMIVTVFINLALNLSLIHSLKQGALALSTAISAL